MVDAETLAIFSHERSKSLSRREWKFRLAGHGYGIHEIEGACIATRLPHGTACGVLPPHLG
ncbi:hypothetical protein DXV76_13155 [Rhodobacteraceae bacterium CCMM004]|nr:hypothetical protein DXV76_13155 [Rhodobacteraceae bacterium CCMM004]